jgi:glycosyltransferase involved in cell wall biosynthesis
MPSIDAIYVAPDLPRGLCGPSGRAHLMRRMFEAVMRRRSFSSWAITTPSMARAFQMAGFHLDYVGPLKTSFALACKIKGRFVSARGWDYTPLGEPMVLKSYARQVERQLRGAKGRVILSLGKPHLAYLRTKLPILFFDDASVPAITKLYPSHRNFYPPTKQNLLAAEQQALEKCRFACYMSEWAAEAALETYGRKFESKIRVVPIGANIADPPVETEVEAAIKSRSTDQCNLLFVGMDWPRKGGPIAVAVAEELHKRGMRVRLDIMGCAPLVSASNFVKVHGFVPSQTEEGRSLIQQLYRESHFFILPSQAEAYGVAFVEANARALPCLGCKVGGVPTVVRDGENGWLFAPDAPPAAYADRIQATLHDPQAYTALCRSSYRAFQTRLSWKQFGESVYALASEAMS